MLKNPYLGETSPHLDMEMWSFFLNGWDIVKLGSDSDNFSALELGGSHEILLFGNNNKNHVW